VFNVVLAGPRLALHLTRRIFAAGLVAAEAVPRIATALDEMRATLRQLERLLAYVAEELPELAYQVEQIRARLDAEPDADHAEPVAPAKARRG
jgi:hypothetical protein